MPLRLLREGILTSERIDQLDAPAEVFYRRLMSKVDDYGLFDARPAILRASLYPLRLDRVREADIARWIAACEKAGVIALYEHGGKPYLQMRDTNWQVRSEPKHPPPPWHKGARKKAPDSKCKQPLAPAHLDEDEGGGDNHPHPSADRGGAFARWWAKYPEGAHKVAEEQCRNRWRRHGLDEFEVEIMAGLEASMALDQWRNGMVPAPLTWLRQERWKAAAAAGGDGRPWHESRSGIESKGVELGLGRWDQQAFELGEGEPFSAYTARVMVAAGEAPRKVAA